MLTSSHALGKVSGTLGFALAKEGTETNQGTPTFDDFKEQFERLRSSGFPVTASLDDAWLAFQAERERYACGTHRLAAAVLAPPAPWL